MNRWLLIIALLIGIYEIRCTIISIFDPEANDASLVARIFRVTIAIGHLLSL